MLITMWTGDAKDEEGGAAAAASAEERSERVVAMRDGTRNENATRLWGDIETDVNEDNVAPWKVDVDVDGVDSDFGCVETEPASASATLGMNEVTTATGCAVSRRSARIFWESPRALILLAARSKEDECFDVASASAKRDIMRPGTQVRLPSPIPSARAEMTVPANWRSLPMSHAHILHLIYFLPPPQPLMRQNSDEI
jgi:hypothetical protein